MATTLDRRRLDGLLRRERADYSARRPRSRAAFAAGEHSLLGGVPMTWMAKWPGGFPPYLAEARGNRVTDLDGLSYLDFCLGDTGAMAGHSPEPTVEAVQHRIADLGGVTAMLPTPDAAEVGEELSRRFGLPRWSFTLSATDANRWAIRLARQVTRRPKILVFSYCYHGSVDETFVVLDGGVARSRPGNVGPAVDPTETTRVVEFNDLTGLERALGAGDVAVVVTEPALTNIGIVLPEPGFHQRLRQLTRETGTLLLIDETHTMSAGVGGCTRAWSLQPDLVTVGKAIGGGVPCGAYGLAGELVDQIMADRAADLVDVGGVGGTLAGNALSVAAMRATLEQVLTDAAFSTMCSLGSRYADGVQQVIDTHGLPWSISRLGARAEYRFTAPAPTSGAESAAAADEELDEYFHLYTANRGILLTPFHNMALVCPTTTAADVDQHVDAFAAAVGELLEA
jgi:glutamate-1-semialdehyde 2,1-aminomutase